MRYPVAVWEENGTYSATVPDLPGVITEADSVDELIFNIKEASLGWMEAELDDGRDIPMPSLVEKYFREEDYKNCVWMLADIDLDKLSDKVERLNICLPSRAIRRLDNMAKKAGRSRSGFLTQMIYTVSP